MDKLKPCPFCGGKAEIKQINIEVACDFSSVMFFFEIQCEKCHATAPGGNGYVSAQLAGYGGLTVLHNDVPEAIKRWNRRASDA